MSTREKVHSGVSIYESLSCNMGGGASVSMLEYRVNDSVALHSVTHWCFLLGQPLLTLAVLLVLPATILILSHNSATSNTIHPRHLHVQYCRYSTLRCLAVLKVGHNLNVRRVQQDVYLPSSIDIADVSILHTTTNRTKNCRDENKHQRPGLGTAASCVVLVTVAAIGANVS